MTTTPAERPATNWAGSYRYTAPQWVAPTTVEELQQVVASADRVKVLGSRHSFTDITDTTGTLVSLAQLPRRIELDPAAGQVTVDGGIRYGDLVEPLHAKGFALANLASLPHISVAGAVATGTHGSGDGIPALGAAVAALELVAPDGSLVRLTRGDDGFDGAVVSLGALGPVASLTLDVEPAFTVRQDVWTGLTWDLLDEHFDAITASGYSVSMFTHWADGVEQVWVKGRVDSEGGSGDGGEPPFPGAVAATAPMHMLRGAETDAVTQQLGVPGPGFERLPHFRLGFTPSRGAELQSEYLLPRSAARDAFAAMRPLGQRLAGVLQVCEIRTTAPDALWLSGSEGRDTVALHFTWSLDLDAVYAVLPAIEEALLPLQGRPHWGKCFVAEADALAPLYPRWTDFADLRDRLDPDRKFGNAFLDRVLA
jgi:xylitol oxidase